MLLRKQYYKINFENLYILFCKIDKIKVLWWKAFFLKKDFFIQRNPEMLKFYLIIRVLEFSNKYGSVKSRWILWSTVVLSSIEIETPWLVSTSRKLLVIIILNIFESADLLPSFWYQSSSLTYFRISITIEYSGDIDVY